MFNYSWEKVLFYQFLDTNAALLMHSEFILKRSTSKVIIFVLDGEKYHYSTRILQAVTNDGATRNVYLGNLSPLDISEEEIINDLSIYGPIECIKTIQKRVLHLFIFLVLPRLFVVLIIYNQKNILKYIMVKIVVHLLLKLNNIMLLNI